MRKIMNFILFPIIHAIAVMVSRNMKIQSQGKSFVKVDNS